MAGVVGYVAAGGEVLAGGWRVGGRAYRWVSMAALGAPVVPAGWVG